MLEYTGLSTTSGEIIKLSDVVAESNSTSAEDQTYIFNFKLDHAVPLQGFFRIMMSTDLVNGAQISNPISVKQSCFFISESQLDKGLECNTGETEEGI